MTVVVQLYTGGHVFADIIYVPSSQVVTFCPNNRHNKSRFLSYVPPITQNRMGDQMLKATIIVADIYQKSKQPLLKKTLMPRFLFRSCFLFRDNDSHY